MKKRIKSARLGGARRCDINARGIAAEETAAVLL